MKRIIFKETITIVDERVTFFWYETTKIIGFDYFRDGIFNIWFETPIVDEGCFLPTEERKFIILPTGAVIDDYYVHIKTIKLQTNDTVWHLYEVKNYL